LPYKNHFINRVICCEVPEVHPNMNYILAHPYLKAVFVSYLEEFIEIKLETAYRHIASYFHKFSQKLTQVLMPLDKSK